MPLTNLDGAWYFFKPLQLVSLPFSKSVQTTFSLRGIFQPRVKFFFPLLYHFKNTQEKNYRANKQYNSCHIMFQCPFFWNTYTFSHTSKCINWKGFSVMIYFGATTEPAKISADCKKIKMFNTITPLLKLAYITLFCETFFRCHIHRALMKKIGYYIVTLIDYTTKLLLLLLHKNSRSE